jgi:hypothetical protein
MLVTRAPALFDVPGGEPTLDDVLSCAWEELIAHRPAACPVCGEPMRPDYGAGGLPIGGSCDRCGATLR